MLLGFGAVGYKYLVNIAVFESLTMVVCSTLVCGLDILASLH